MIFRELRVQQGASPAWAFARGALRHHPSLLGLDRLLEAELANSDGAAEDGPVQGADLTLLRSLIHKHTQRLDRYACQLRLPGASFLLAMSWLQRVGNLRAAPSRGT